MVNRTIKFSEMTAGGDLSNDNKTPGLLGGNNVLFNNPWTFLPSGTTAQRPPPSSEINYRLRLNTEEQVYEYYDAFISQWVELSGSGTGTVNPGLANSISFYETDGTTVSPTNQRARSFLITDTGGIPSLSNSITAVEDQSTNTTAGTPTLYINNSTGINYPSVSNFLVTIGTYNNNKLNSSQTINSGVNFVFGNRSVLTTDDEGMNDLRSLTVIGESSQVNWLNNSNSIEQLIAHESEVIYEGVSVAGRNLINATSDDGNIIIRTPSSGSATITNIIGSKQLCGILNQVSTGVTQAIANIDTFSSEIDITNTALNNVTTVGNLSAFESFMAFDASGAGSSIAITNLYGLFLRTPSITGSVTITNRFGIYQQGPSSINHFEGPLALTTPLAVTSGGTGISAIPSNGQIPIGNGTNYVAAALTAGAGITISPGAGSVTIASSVSPGVSWAGIAGTTQLAASNFGYIIQNAAQTTVTLPATSVIGDIVAIQGLGAGGWVMKANIGQVIHVGQTPTSSGGTITSAANYNAISVVCIVANTTWSVNSDITAGFTIA